MVPLRVIADDLTGACDVAAALLPWPEPVLVAIDPAGAGTGGGLRVANTASRTLPPAEAAARVRRALRDLPSASVVLKKIDTGLRGPLGAEIDAAMEATGAAEAFVLAAIPEAGRTTVGGVQLADGVPVDRTAFASDPENPVREARVAHAIEATGARRAGVVDLAALRRGDVDGAVERVRASGASVVVVDAESSADLARAVAAILRRPGPHLLVGSTGLARALRDAVAGAAPDADTAAVAVPAAGGVLTIVGSVHPVARGQVACVRERGLATIAEADGAGVGERAARAIARGEHVVVVAPARPDAEGGALAALARVSEAATRIARPGGLVLVGGETAQRVLAGLGVEALRVEGAPAPLVVRSRAIGGSLAGLRVVTKGGSSGPPERLADMIAEAAA